MVVLPQILYFLKTLGFFLFFSFWHPVQWHYLNFDFVNGSLSISSFQILDDSIASILFSQDLVIFLFTIQTFWQIFLLVVLSFLFL